MVTVFGRGGVGATLIQWGKGRRPDGALIWLLPRWRLWRMAAYSVAAGRTGDSGASSGGRRRPLVMGQVTSHNSGGLEVLGVSFLEKENNNENGGGLGLLGRSG
jgi:hypothetical protein